ncbi:tetratricopeptide repeat protein [Rhodocaloribacter litoris]|uniref:tetratricopeptide repeat protein n=1 Tax=Rhodocaloribacter litoris TaxID=2558931 RepID=UPI00141EE701|nr:tetratricopeptide repeat protein [Rhodocaloribacter litoris]QXD14301.1 tetratricopeptide repeat protein [Rhodocaloribacter litoris]
MKQWTIKLMVGGLLALTLVPAAATQPVRRPPVPPAHGMVRTPQLDAQYHRAEAAWKSGASLLEAKTRLDRVLEALPDDQPARKLRARVLLALDRPADALRDAEHAVRLDPDDGEAYTLLCEAARRSGNLARAEQALDAAARHVFDDADLHLRLSWNAVELERLDHAEAFARIALVQAPHKPAAYYQLARVFALQHRPGDAATVLAQGFRRDLLDPKHIREDAVLHPLATHPLLAPWMQ